MKRIKVGDYVLLHGGDDTRIFKGRMGKVRYANTPGNVYYVGNFLNTLSHQSYMDVTREEITVVTADSHPELFI